MFSPADFALTSNAPVGRLHDARSAARDDYVVAPGLVLAGCRDEPGEVSSDVVISALGQQAAGALHLAAAAAGRWASRPAGRWQAQTLLRQRRFHNSRTAKNHDRRNHVVLFKNHLRLEQLKLHPHRPQPRVREKVDVLVGKAIAWRMQNLLQALAIFIVSSRRLPNRIQWFFGCFYSCRRSGETTCGQTRPNRISRRR